ncbi:MAG: hypothetical protein PUH03_02460 [bacterium]|nr:hypothetical protein [bacterium]MDY2830047.1 hypothetical protein [Alphaproteobacteria bacterium]
MSELVKKTSVLGRLKNIVAKTKRRFSWRGRVKDENVSALDASDIQQEAFTHNQNLRHNVYTPPYMELAAQLLAAEDQIFEAAALQLTAIAKSRRKYAPEIKSIFAEVVAGRKLPPEKIEYLTKKIKEI